MLEDPEKRESIDEAPAQGNVENPPEPASLRVLRVLVTVLTGVMIVGMVALIVLFFTRFPPATPTALPALPERIALPEDAQPQAVTVGSGWVGVVTTDGRMLFFDAENGELLREIRVMQGD